MRSIKTKEGRGRMKRNEKPVVDGNWKAIVANKIVESQSLYSRN